MSRVARNLGIYHSTTYRLQEHPHTTTVQVINHEAADLVSRLIIKTFFFQLNKTNLSINDDDLQSKLWITCPEGLNGASPPSLWWLVLLNKLPNRLFIATLRKKMKWKVWTVKRTERSSSLSRYTWFNLWQKDPDNVQLFYTISYHGILQKKKINIWNNLFKSQACPRISNDL